MVFGGLYVSGGIDPTYLALEPQVTVPFSNLLQGIWMEDAGPTGIAPLRVQKIALDDFQGVTAGIINIDPIQNPQITLSDGIPTNELTLNNNEINLVDNSITTTTTLTTSNLSQTTAGPTTITATIYDIITKTNSPTIPTIDQVLGAGNLATAKTQLFADGTGSNSSSLSASSLILQSTITLNNYHTNLGAGSAEFGDDDDGSTATISSQIPQFRLYGGSTGVVTQYNTQEINCNNTFAINTSQLSVGSELYMNSNLHLQSNNIYSVNNINLNTINGLSPTTIGLTWADFTGNNAYNNLPNQAYEVAQVGIYTRQLYNQFVLNNNGIYSAILDDQNLNFTYLPSGVNMVVQNGTIYTNGQDITLTANSSSSKINLNCAQLLINVVP
jgi:hypothetical protein